MRKYVVVASVLVATGVGVSFLLIPNEGDVAVMQSKDVQTINTGNIDLEAEYNQGRRSFPIMSALADKKIAAGDRPGAIKVLEDYVASNGADAKGHKKLAEQYQLAGRQADYNAQLEAVAASEPTEANLRLLSDIYNGNKDYKKQAAVLQKMVDVTHGAKPETYVDLATIQVASGDTDGALKTVEALRSKHAGFSSYPTTRIMVNVLAGKGDVDRAFQIANEWLNTPSAPVPAVPPQANTAPITPDAASDPRPKELADLCNILHYSGHADKAVALVEPHLEMLQREPELVVAYVNANMTAGRSDHAYAILQKIDEAGKMVPSLYPSYLELAIKREDIPAAQTIVNKMDITAFNEEQALNIVELARSNHATLVLEGLLGRFNNPQLLEGKPVLPAVIALLRNEKEQDVKINAALAIELSSTQRIRLAESCALAKKTACFDTILKKFPAIDRMSPAQVAEYAQLFIIADRAGELVDPIGYQAKQPNAHADVQSAYRRLAAATGRYDVLKPWLAANANTAPATQLQELFYLANDRHHRDVAADVAERLYARDPSPMNRDIVIAGYMGADQPEKALPLLRTQVAEAGANDAAYIAALTKLAHKNGAARTELITYAKAALKAQHGDARQQLNYAYALINNGEKAAVIPYAKQYAAERGGEWKKMFAQLTQKAGSSGTAAAPLTREQMLTLAQSKTISAANKRQLGFNLLKAGYKADATAIFKELAADKGPNSQEVQDLLYLWGGKITGEQLVWLHQRAAAANAYDKPKWGELIANNADDGAVMRYVSATPDALYNTALRQKYFRILAETGSRQNYEIAMRDWVAQTTDVAAMMDYATTAQAHGYREAAMAGFKRLLVLDPTNRKALNQLAALDFGKGKYAEADQALNRYLGTPALQVDADTAQAHFYKAELLRRQGNMQAAIAEYQQVVQLSIQQQVTAADALSRLYTAQFHVGQHAQAKEGFNHLLAQHPNDKSLLADYMAMLIEYHYVQEATSVANHYDKPSPADGKGAALQGKSAHVASIESISGGREIRIHFDQPIENNAPIDMKKSAKLAWLEHSELGYDSMTISAKPGYVVRYIPTAQEQFVVVPAAAPEYAPQVEIQRQQELRLQLLYARIEQESGQTAQASERLAAVARYYPQDPQLLAAQAGLESAQGNHETAIAMIQQARALAPENEGYVSMAAASDRRVETKQFVKLDREYRNYGSTEENIVTASAVVRVARALELGVNLMHNYLSPDKKDGIVNPNTGLISKDDADRSAGEMFAAYYLDDGSRAQASLYSNLKTAGAGASYTFPNRLGTSELVGDYHKTYWDFPDAAYSYATRDRVGFKHFANLTKTTSFGLETSINNYNTDVKDNIARSGLVRISLVQELQAQKPQQPFFGLGYGFDGEYLFNTPSSRTSASSGITYHPLNIINREVHQLTGIYRDDWGARTHVLFDAGWVADRYTENNGPVVEGTLTQDLTATTELGLRGRYSHVSANGGSGDAVNVGANVKVKF
jgi:tetratricopeptide (TPR) repeat protein